MGISFCPQAVEWGDIATWVASAATLAAVGIALWTSNQALRQTRALKDADDVRLEATRKLKAKAYAAAVVDNFWRAMKHMKFADEILDQAIAQNDHVTLVTSALFELSEIDSSISQRMLEHVEVFGDKGKYLARVTVGLMELEHSSKRNHLQVQRLMRVPNGFTAQLKKSLRTESIRLREVAQIFYGIAEIEPESRSIQPLSDDEKKEFGL